MSKGLPAKQCPGCKRNVSASNAGRHGEYPDKGQCLNRNCPYFRMDPESAESQMGYEAFMKEPRQ